MTAKTKEKLWTESDARAEAMRLVHGEGETLVRQLGEVASKIRKVGRESGKKDIAEEAVEALTDLLDEFVVHPHVDLVAGLARRSEEQLRTIFLEGMRLRDPRRVRRLARALKEDKRRPEFVKALDTLADRLEEI